VLLSPSGQAAVSEQSDGFDGLFRARHARQQLVTQALTALHLFERDRHYIVANGEVQIVDEYTGRVMPDRKWEQGLHQLVEAKEGVALTGTRETLARGVVLKPSLKPAEVIVDASLLFSLLNTAIDWALANTQSQVEFTIAIRT